MMRTQKSKISTRESQPRSTQFNELSIKPTKMLPARHFVNDEMTSGAGVLVNNMNDKQSWNTRAVLLLSYHRGSYRKRLHHFLPEKLSLNVNALQIQDVIIIA
jgi:hypothetical protein